MEENEYWNSHQPEQQPYNQQPEQSQYYSQPNQPYMPPEQEPKPGAGMSVASMVLGIVSIVLCCFWYIGVICAVIGLVLGIVSIKKGPSGKGMAIAGIILSCITLLLVILILAFSNSSSYTELINSFSEAFEEGYNNY